MSELMGYNYAKERGRVYSAESHKGFASCFNRFDDLGERIDALEQRIDDLDKIAAEYRFNIVALERRIEKLERKLNHKGGDE